MLLSIGYYRFGNWRSARMLPPGAGLPVASAAASTSAAIKP